MPETNAKLTRRSVLAATALSALGSSTAVARLQSSVDAGSTASVDDGGLTRDETGWPQPGYDNGRTAYSGASAPTTELSVAWERDDSDRPFLVAGGRLYYSVDGDEATTVHAVDAADGSDLWTTEVGSEAYAGSRALGRHAGAVVDGRVFFCTYGRTVALDAEDGSELWSADTGGMSVGVTADSVVVGNTNGELTVLSREDANVRWRRDLDVTLQFAVVDGVVYVSTDGSDESLVVALRVDDGSELWSGSFESDHGFVAATDDQVYYWRANEFYTLDADTGETLWTKEGGTLDYGEVENVALHAVGAGVVYATVDEEFGAYDAETGEAQWTVESSPSTSGPTVAGDVMYSTAYNGVDETETLVVRSLDGDVVAEHGVEGVSGEVIPTADALYVTTRDDRLLALRGSSEDGSDGDDGESEDGNDDGDETGESDESDGSDVDDGC
ncbi:PQQ-like domain-containing protein [Halogranum amylolyticum]|uniref:PQQ-like domain-containing protein n=1 Tax=Halogranum amylolyticum TaxID=660520 RepID=A0A1H8NAI7_9EURY|nr:PQQ-binding-like beta-propeller repeat protein [Halogranum amylolyticum]SEO26615.1 PQQ-like domain-containing protein [Halogranum amylolyticum]